MQPAYIAQPLIGNEEIEAVRAVLASGKLVQGEQVRAFESAFAGYIGAKYAVAVNSGTAALHLALLAAGIQEGDEVITSPFTFIASASSILMAGAIPVFCDIDKNTYNIDPAALESSITVRTKAILAVHLFGLPCDMSELSRVAAAHELILIEDCAQSHGAEWDGKRTGSYGNAGCFSFYGTKNMTCGEGGMLVTDDEDVAARSRQLRNHGQTAKYVHEVLGWNYRMTDIAAAIGLCQLRKLTRFNAQRVANSEFLNDLIGDVEGIAVPTCSERATHVFHQYTMQVLPEFGHSRDEVIEYLSSADVHAGVYYRHPLHTQPLFRRLGYQQAMPVTEDTAQRVVSLPIHPSITEEQLSVAARRIRELSEV